MAMKSEFRRTQGIVPYGVGAIVDFPDESLMAAGLDVWLSEVTEGDARKKILDATEIVDGRLQRRLTAQYGRPIRRFLTPIEAPPRGNFAAAHSDTVATGLMPFVRFPEWHFCTRCRLLWKVPWNTPTNDARRRCNGQIRLSKGEAKFCADLKPDYRKPTLVPVRFAVACDAGHISDFPWIEWLHANAGQCVAGSGEIFLVSTGGAGLDGIEVRCSKCPERRTLRGAFRQNKLRSILQQGCPGTRPWLGPDALEPDCTRDPQVIQRGASNIYFPKIVSSILIPPHSEHLRMLVDRPEVWTVIEVLSKNSGLADDVALAALADAYNVELDAFRAVVIAKLDEESGATTAAPTEEQYRSTEYQAFLGNRPPREDRRDFDISPIPVPDYLAPFESYFSDIVLIPRLRETRVLEGFTRLVPPEATASDLSPLSIEPKSWLPGVEVRGEGIFLTLNRDTLADWHRSNSDFIEIRVAAIGKRLRTTCLERNMAIRVLPANFLLLHTLAHLLIRQLSFDCGYDSSSLRERLYSSDDGMNGILIYTASGDSEGSMGGLVRQGKPRRLERTVWAAIENAKFCSSDPLCLSSDGQGVNGLNLAACHACCLLPETSCEEGNRLLDRALIIGTDDVPESGFMSLFTTPQEG